MYGMWVATVGIGLDGTCMLIGEEGYREAMVGTLSLYDSEGERQQTIYLVGLGGNRAIRVNLTCNSC
jgi:hypothetical protein